MDPRQPHGFVKYASMPYMYTYAYVYIDIINTCINIWPVLQWIKQGMAVTALTALWSTHHGAHDRDIVQHLHNDFV